MDDDIASKSTSWCVLKIAFLNVPASRHTVTITRTRIYSWSLKHSNTAEEAEGDVIGSQLGWRTEEIYCNDYGP